MTRDPDVLQALTDLRPVFAMLRKAKQQLGLAEVRTNLDNQAAVEAQLRDARSRISTRAERIAISSDSLTAILSIDAKERLRLKRRPSLRQMAAAIRVERAAAAERAAIAKKRLGDALTEHTAATRADEAALAACRAFTGYEN